MAMRKNRVSASLFFTTCATLALACSLSGAAPKPSAAPTTFPSPTPNRESRIPTEAVKIQLAQDLMPPVLHQPDWEPPIPLPGQVNTAGAEDSPFITLDGGRMYFFFTPDAGIPAQEQLGDGVTGIYMARLEGDQWVDVQRVSLASPGELALDGCPTALGDALWFCSARAGNLREIDLWIAKIEGDQHIHWVNAGELLNTTYEVGEMHLSSDGQCLYYHSRRAGGLGGMDLWELRRQGETWGEPRNLQALNSEGDEGWPYLTPDGQELWFTRAYQGSPAIFRSLKGDSGWSEPDLILSSFAGELAMDPQGNLYFTHHFVDQEGIIEADIYVAYRRTP